MYRRNRCGIIIKSQKFTGLCTEKHIFVIIQYMISVLYLESDKMVWQLYNRDLIHMYVTIEEDVFAEKYSDDEEPEDPPFN